MNSIGIMLVHGGGATAKSWERLIPHLKYPVLAVDLPGRGRRARPMSAVTLSDFVAESAADLDAFKAVEKVVLVGHSMAGVTIPGIAARRPERVAEIVFVSCFVPREGGTILGEQPWWARLAIKFLSRGTPKPMPARIARHMFHNDMNDEQIAFSQSSQVTEATSVFSEKISRRDMPPPHIVPRTYIKLLRDNAIKPSMQDRFIKHIGHCAIETIDAGHNVMISQPEQLAVIINRICARASVSSD